MPRRRRPPPAETSAATEAASAATAAIANSSELVAVRLRIFIASFASDIDPMSPRARSSNSIKKFTFEHLLASENGSHRCAVLHGDCSRDEFLSFDESV